MEPSIIPTNREEISPPLHVLVTTPTTQFSGTLQLTRKEMILRRDDSSDIPILADDAERLLEIQLNCIEGKSLIFVFQCEQQCTIEFSNTETRNKVFQFIQILYSR